MDSELFRLQLGKVIHIAQIVHFGKIAISMQGEHD